MMDNLRAAANHVVLKIILGLIIVSFILTGVGNYLIGGNNNYAAKVNGQEISRAQFENAFASERARLQRDMGERYSQLAANEQFMQSVRQMTLQRLVDEALLDQYAHNLKLEISDEQIRAAIFNNPGFQRGGKFDNDQFKAVLAQAGMSPDQYAQALRKQLTTDQFINAVVGSDFMLKGETDEVAALLYQQRLVREAVIDVKALLAKQNVSDAEAENYYQQHKENFIAPEQFRVSYIKMDAAELKQDASEAEIQAYYDGHQDQYTQPQRNRYRIIQAKTETEAKALLDELHKGADFATLAKEKSSDITTARNGGDMGWLEPATTPDELKNAGLKEKGQLSEVIKFSQGYFIARLDDIQPAKQQPFAEVHDAIADKVKQEKALDAYFALQQKVSEAASNDNESLASAAQVSGLKVEETDWFTRGNLPANLDFKPVASVIFDGSLLGQNGAPGSNSTVITVDGDRAFVLRISGHKAETVKPLAAVKDQVIAAVKQQKAQQQARQDADKLLAQLKAGKGKDALSAAGLTFSDVKTLDRNGKDSLTRSVFALPLPAKDKPSYGIAEDSNGNVVLLALEDVRSGSLPDAQKAAMAKGIVENNAQIAFEALMANLRKEAKIKIGDSIQTEPQQ